jgi:hypothetical protein
LVGLRLDERRRVIGSTPGICGQRLQRVPQARQDRLGCALLLGRGRSWRGGRTPATGGGPYLPEQFCGAVVRQLGVRQPNRKSRAAHQVTEEHRPIQAAPDAIEHDALRTAQQASIRDPPRAIPDPLKELLRIASQRHDERRWIELRPAQIASRCHDLIDQRADVFELDGRKHDRRGSRLSRLTGLRRSV